MKCNIASFVTHVSHHLKHETTCEKIELNFNVIVMYFNCEYPKAVQHSTVC